MHAPRESKFRRSMSAKEFSAALDEASSRGSLDLEQGGERRISAGAIATASALGRELSRPPKADGTVVEIECFVRCADILDVAGGGRTSTFVRLLLETAQGAEHEIGRTEVQPSSLCPQYRTSLRLRFRAGDTTHRLRFEVCDARDGAAVIAAARVGLVELHTQAARDVDEQALSSDAAALSLPLQQLTHLLATAGAVSERSMKEHGGTQLCAILHTCDAIL